MLYTWQDSVTARKETESICLHKWNEKGTRATTILSMCWAVRWGEVSSGQVRSGQFHPSPSPQTNDLAPFVKVAIPQFALNYLIGEWPHLSLLAGTDLTPSMPNIALFWPTPATHPSGFVQHILDNIISKKLFLQYNATFKVIMHLNYLYFNI